jgi:hypothetical protein
VSSGDANVRNEVAYKSAALDLSLDQSIREGLETYGGSTRIKFLSPWSFGYTASYDAIQDSFERQSYQVRYDSNASKCWYFSFDVDRRPDPDQPGKELVRYWPRVGLIINEAGVSL